jgi:hypothetical protein
LGFEFVGVLYCELCNTMVDVRNPSIFAKNLELGLDKHNNLCYNDSITNNGSMKGTTMISSEMIYEAYLEVADKVVSLQILGKGMYLLHMVGDEFPQKLNSYAVMSVLDPELDEEDMQVALAEYEHYEANWEEVESDDSHRESYEDWNTDQSSLDTLFE